MTQYESEIAKNGGYPHPANNDTPSPRPQRMHTWFNLIPVDEYEQKQPDQILFLDTFVTIKTSAEEQYEVLFEGDQPMVVVINMGIIFVWYGENLQVPDRPFPVFQEHPYPTKYVTSSASIFENTHIMDFVENGSDNLHFRIVHLWNHSKIYNHAVNSDTITLEQDTKFNFGSCSDSAFTRFMSRFFPLELKHDYVYHGPSLAVVGAEGSGSPDMHALVSLTPEGINRTRVYVTIALSPDTFPKAIEKTVKAVSGKQACDVLASIMANYIKNEFDVDRVIWKNRKWLPEPNLIASEKHLAEVIQWGETFYPKEHEYPKEVIKTDEEKQWHPLANIKQLSDSKIATFNIDNKEIVAYKTSRGDVKIYDAYCPHQGAHLGFGGIIEDDCLRCPFHGFYFNESGNCSGQKINKERALKGLDLTAIPFQMKGDDIEVLI